jgi:pimeloyl-ACP methyl ester carboxylesterase
MMIVRLGLALLLVACTAPASAPSEPGASALPPPPSIQAVEPETVELQTADGLTIVTSAYGPADAERGIVMGHQVNGSRPQWERMSQELAARGYRVLAIDFRGFGDSDDGEIRDLHLDLAAAVAHLRQHGVQGVAVAGASMGAAAAARMAQDVDIEALLLFSSPLDFDRLRSTADDLAVMEMPKLFVCAEGDPGAYQAMRDLFEAAAEPKQQLWLSGDNHGTELFAGDHATEVIRATVEFLDQHLRS